MTDIERKLRENLDEANFQLRLMTWIAAACFFGFVIVLAWR